MGSLFHPKVRWGEDGIFNTPAGIGRKACPAGGVKGVHGFHQANGPDGEQIVLITGLRVILFGDVGHQPQIVPDELFSRVAVSGPQGGKGLDLFPGAQGPGKASGFQMQRQNQKFCGEKLQQCQ